MDKKEIHRKKSLFLKAFEDYSDAIFRFGLSRLSDRDKATDLTQDTFLRVWNYLQKNDAPENLRAFIYKVASNLIIDEYRKTRPSESLETMSEEKGFEPSAEELSLPGDRVDGQKAIEMIKQVPEPYGSTLFMRFVEELTLTEISSITGQSENAVSVQVHRGIGKLRKIWNHEDKK